MQDVVVLEPLPVPVRAAANDAEEDNDDDEMGNDEELYNQAMEALKATRRA